MSKHTPGPWGFQVRNVSAGSIATVYGTDEGWVEIYSADWAKHELDGHQQSANARLIAAAPELLEALQDALMIFEFGDDDKTVMAPEWVARTRAAIANATGEQP